MSLAYNNWCIKAKPAVPQRRYDVLCTDWSLRLHTGTGTDTTATAVIQIKSLDDLLGKYKVY